MVNEPISVKPHASHTPAISNQRYYLLIQCWSQNIELCTKHDWPGTKLIVFTSKELASIQNPRMPVSQYGYSAVTTNALPCPALPCSARPGNQTAHTSDLSSGNIPLGQPV